jgi:hypothetical protein
VAGFLVLLVILFLGHTDLISGAKIAYQNDNEIPPIVKDAQVQVALKPSLAPLDTIAYDLKLKELANITPVSPVVVPPATGAASKNKVSVPKVIKPIIIKPILWPVKAAYPNSGAILPFNRIVAYYGNLYSKKMGALGAYPEAEMLQKLDVEVQKWNAADPTTPVIPALHYVAVTAQGSKGGDGKYIFRMPSSEIEKVLAMAKKINAIVFLDVQVGLSNLQTELPLLEKYLKMPQVHLGIDPEFSMKTGAKPGKVVGTMDAEDINFAADYLAKLVKENNLTPKVLIVHRYTQKMVTNYTSIKPLPEVQIVMDMDGWGDPDKKITTYRNFIYKEPVQFTGFKLFYKNDLLEPKTALMTPKDVLKLKPQPIYIQYQ